MYQTYEIPRFITKNDMQKSRALVDTWPEKNREATSLVATTTENLKQKKMKLLKYDIENILEPSSRLVVLYQQNIEALNKKISSLDHVIQPYDAELVSIARMINLKAQLADLKKTKGILAEYENKLATLEGNLRASHREQFVLSEIIAGLESRIAFIRQQREVELLRPNSSGSGFTELVIVVEEYRPSIACDEENRLKETRNQLKKEKETEARITRDIKEANKNISTTKLKRGTLYEKISAHSSEEQLAAENTPVVEFVNLKKNTILLASPYKIERKNMATERDGYVKRNEFLKTDILDIITRCDEEKYFYDKKEDANLFELKKEVLEGRLTLIHCSAEREVLRAAVSDAAIKLDIAAVSCRKMEVEKTAISNNKFYQTYWNSPEELVRRLTDKINNIFLQYQEHYPLNQSEQVRRCLDSQLEKISAILHGAPVYDEEKVEEEEREKADCRERYFMLTGWLFALQNWLSVNHLSDSLEDRAFVRVVEDLVSPGMLDNFAQKNEAMRAYGPEAPVLERQDFLDREVAGWKAAKENLETELKHFSMQGNGADKFQRAGRLILKNIDSAEKKALKNRQPFDIGFAMKLVNKTRLFVMSPGNTQIREDFEAFAELNPDGAPSWWRRAVGVMDSMAGVSMTGFGVALREGALPAIPEPARQYAECAAYVAGSVVTICGAVLFRSGQRRGMSKATMDMADASRELNMEQQRILPLPAETGETDHKRRLPPAYQSV